MLIVLSYYKEKVKERNLQSCRRSLRLRRFNQSDPDYPLQDSNLLLVNTDRRRSSDKKKKTDIKFIVRPGYLEDNNGHCHYIDENILIELYDVATSECLVLHNKYSTLMSIQGA